MEKELSVSKPSALTALRELENAGLLRQLESMGPYGQHKWQAPEILEILNED